MESMLAEAQAALMDSGPQSIVSWSDNASSVNKQIQMSAADWLDEIVYSLALINPEKYADRITPNQTTAGFLPRYNRNTG